MTFLPFEKGEAGTRVSVQLQQGSLRNRVARLPKGLRLGAGPSSLSPCC